MEIYLDKDTLKRIEQAREEFQVGKTITINDSTELKTFLMSLK